MVRRCALNDKALRGGFAALLFAFLPAPAPAQAPEAPNELLITITGNSGAFATGVFNSSIRDNVVNLTDPRVVATQLFDSVLNNRGIVQINQDAGIASNQTNLVLITASAGGTEAIADASFHAQLETTGHAINLAGGITRSNTIQNALNGSAGIAQISQNSGTLNVNLNALVIGLGIGTGNGAASMADSSLSAVASNIQFTATGPITQTNTISGITNFTGIAQITQSVGDANIASNVLTLSVTVLNIP